MDNEQYLDQDFETPAISGMYDPDMARDACGVGFIADITGKKPTPQASRAISEIGRAHV